MPDVIYRRNDGRTRRIVQPVARRRAAAAATGRCRFMANAAPSPRRYIVILNYNYYYETS